MCWTLKEKVSASRLTDKVWLIILVHFSWLMARGSHECSQRHAHPLHSLRSHEAATFIVDAANHEISNFVLSCEVEGSSLGLAGYERS